MLWRGLRDRLTKREPLDKCPISPTLPPSLFICVLRLYRPRTKLMKYVLGETLITRVLFFRRILCFTGFARPLPFREFLYTIVVATYAGLLPSCRKEKKKKNIFTYAWNILCYTLQAQEMWSLNFFFSLRRSVLPDVSSHFYNSLLLVKMPYV